MNGDWKYETERGYLEGRTSSRTPGGLSKMEECAKDGWDSKVPVTRSLKG